MVAADTTGGAVPVAASRPFGALAAAADALRTGPPRPARPRDAGAAEHTGGVGNGHGRPDTRRGSTGLADAAATPSTPQTNATVRQLLASAVDALDEEDRHRTPAAVGGTITTALTLARAHGGSIAVSDTEHIELGLALRRRLARAGATTGADFDGDRLRVQPTEAADNHKEEIT